MLSGELGIGLPMFFDAVGFWSLLSSGGLVAGGGGWGWGHMCVPCCHVDWLVALLDHTGGTKGA